MTSLTANPGFRLLWSSRSVSLLGDSLSLVVLLLYIAANTGQALAVAALMLVSDVAPGLLGPFTGTVGDRFALPRVLVVCDLLQGAAMLIVGLALPPLPVLLALVGLRGVAGQVFGAASRAVLPVLVADEELERANSAIGFGTNAMAALGPLLAAALLPTLGIRGVLLADAATFATSAVLLARLPGRARVGGPRARTSIRADAGVGLRYLRTEQVLRIVTVGFLAVVAFNGVDDVALVFLTRSSLGGSQSDTALLYAAVGIGLLAGYTVLARRPGRSAPLTLLLLGFAVSSAGNLGTGFAWAVPAAFGLQAVRGIGLSAIDVASTTLFQRRVPPHLLARTFGNLYGAIGVAAGLSYLLGAALLTAASARTTFVVAGGGGLLATAVTALALARTRPSSTRLR